MYSKPMLAFFLFHSSNFWSIDDIFCIYNLFTRMIQNGPHYCPKSMTFGESFSHTKLILNSNEAKMKI